MLRDANHLSLAANTEMVEQSQDTPSSSKRQLVWDWKRGCTGDKHPVPEKKKKPDEKNNREVFLLGVLGKVITGQERRKVCYFK